MRGNLHEARIRIALHAGARPSTSRKALYEFVPAGSALEELLVLDAAIADAAQAALARKGPLRSAIVDGLGRAEADAATVDAAAAVVLGRVRMLSYASALRFLCSKQGGCKPVCHGFSEALAVPRRGIGNVQCEVQHSVPHGTAVVCSAQAQTHLAQLCAVQRGSRQPGRVCRSHMCRLAHACSGNVYKLLACM